MPFLLFMGIYVHFIWLILRFFMVAKLTTQFSGWPPYCKIVSKYVSFKYRRKTEPNETLWDRIFERRCSRRV